FDRVVFRETTEAVVRDALRFVVDPELGINVVDLGLVYGVEVKGDAVSVALSTTTAVCPGAAQLRGEAEAALWMHVPGARTVQVTLVRDPPWKPEMMSEGARRELGV